MKVPVKSRLLSWCFDKLVELSFPLCLETIQKRTKKPYDGSHIRSYISSNHCSIGSSKWRTITLPSVRLTMAATFSQHSWRVHTRPSHISSIILMIPWKMRLTYSSGWILYPIFHTPQTRNEKASWANLQIQKINKRRWYQMLACMLGRQFFLSESTVKTPLQKFRHRRSWLSLWSYL